MGNSRFNDYEQRILNPRRPLELQHRDESSFAAMSRRWGERSRLQNALSGQQTQTTVPDLQLSTTAAAGITVKGKTQVGKGNAAKYFLKDGAGNVYQVDKEAYKAATKGRKIPLAGKAAKPVDAAKLPKQVRNNLHVTSGTTTQVTQQAGGVVTGGATQSTQQAATAGTNQFGRPVHGNGVSFAEMSQSWDGKKPNAPVNTVITGGTGNTGNVNVVTTPRNTRINAGMIDDSFGGYQDSPLTEYYRNGGEHGFKPVKLTTDPSPVDANYIDDMLGIGRENTILDGMNDNYRFLEERSNLKRRIGEHLNKPTELSPEIIDDLTGHGVNRELDAMGDYYRALENQNPVGDVAKKVDWKKIGKYGAIAAGVAAVVGLGIWAYKKHKDNKAEEAAQQDLKPVLPEEKLDIDSGLDLPKIEVPKFEIPKLDIEDGDNAEKPENTEVKTEYTTVKGDSFWKIAERHLKDKFKNEPDKFENLTTQEKNRLIYKETMRIMELNGYKLDENKWFSDPMLHPNVKLKLEEKVDIAA